MPRNPVTCACAPCNPVTSQGGSAVTCNPVTSKTPPGWAWATLGEVATLGPKPDRDRLSLDMLVSFVPMRSVEPLSGYINVEETRPASEVMRGYTYFEDGDVLSAKVTPCMENGKVAIARGLKNGIGFGSTEFHVTRPGPGLTPEYVFFYLIQQTVRSDARRSMGGAVGLLRVPVSFLAELELPLPPFPEQRRIVAKIEELFSQLDAGVEELKKAKAQLKRYRQSVLKAAFEGKLTEEWRKAYKGKVEPASVLLERIKAERKKALGPKHKEPLPLDTSELPELPKGWAWARLDEIGNSMLGKMLDKAKHTTGTLLPYLRNVNVRWGYVDTADVASMFFKADETERYSVAAGDVLVCEGGEPGRAAVWDGRVQNMRFQKAIHRVRLPASILPRWFVLQLRVDAWQGRLESYFTGSTIKHFTGEGLSRYAVRIATTVEQSAVVAEVEQRLSIADAEEKAIDAALKQAARLRQSILKRAFEGGLVPQDPSDEPATELLKRIREQRLARSDERLVRRQKRLGGRRE